MELVRRSGQPATVVHEHYGTDGSQRFVEVVASPLWGPDGTFQGIIEMTHDITGRKAIEDILAEQARISTRSDDDLGQFADKVVKFLQEFLGEAPED